LAAFSEAFIAAKFAIENMALKPHLHLNQEALPLKKFLLSGAG
jgi:hypothetical protein